MNSTDKKLMRNEALGPPEPQDRPVGAVRESGTVRILPSEERLSQGL